MNVLTNHWNGHGGVSQPESQTPCHALFLVMQISQNNARDITPHEHATKLCHSRAYLSMHLCTHMDI